ncbi:MAG TPA: peptidase domain-containing ABC transporter [Hellea balneolensis]|uniref:Peptidase domain-containing ABC transporter n=1 Tax=Hellea balneolensis TaxID=287478 RepID=A0A7C3GBG0_9PROT|nr:peptidase domain-containing ABC transporter [Hellea balneolensis]
MINPFAAARLPVVLQTEATECGLACLVMIARYYGHDIDLNSLRKTAAVSLKGASLKQVMTTAGSLHLSSRPLRVELDQLHKLHMPAILHWDLNHFIVLKKIKNGKVHFIDPGRGLRVMSLEKVSDHFSGVALELTPAADFNLLKDRLKPKLSDLWQKMIGLKRAAFQTLLLSLILQFIALASPFYLQLVVDRAINPNDPKILLVFLLGFGALAIIRAGAEAVRGWAILVYGNQMSFQMIGNIVRHLLRLPTSWFEKRHVGDIISRIGSARPIQEALTESVVAILLDGVMALFTLAIMVMYSPKLAALVFGMTALLAVLNLLLYPHLRRTEEEAIITKAIENTHVIESIRASTTIKLFGREAAREAAWRNLFADTINAQTTHGKYLVAQKFLETLLIGLQMVLAVYLGAQLILGESSFATIGMLFAFLGYQRHFTDSATRFLKEGIKFRLLSLHLDRLADIVYEQSEDAQEDSENAISNPAKKGDAGGNIDVDNVSFRYSDNDPFVLKNLDLHIKAGSLVAITGASGGGKTTLMKLLLGLYAPTSGSIKIDGQNLNEFGRANWRAHIGVVMQDDQLLSGTIADNISFFDPQVDLQKVYRAADAAQIHDEIVAIPMNYLSMVGDMGSVLSGGQKQRVLLARALYHDPKVLFLDEGTANLDVETEKKIADVLDDMKITRIVVAHRQELISRADHVFRIEKL